MNEPIPAGSPKPRRRGRAKGADIHKRLIKVVIVIEAVDGAGSVRAHLHDLESGKSFAIDRLYAGKAQCAAAGAEITEAAIAKAIELLTPLTSARARQHATEEGEG